MGLVEVIQREERQVNPQEKHTRKKNIQMADQQKTTPETVDEANQLCFKVKQQNKELKSSDLRFNKAPKKQDSGNKTPVLKNWLNKMEDLLLSTCPFSSWPSRKPCDRGERGAGTGQTPWLHCLLLCGWCHNSLILVGFNIPNLIPVSHRKKRIIPCFLYL